MNVGELGASRKKVHTAQENNCVHGEIWTCDLKPTFDTILNKATNRLLKS